MFVILARVVDTVEVVVNIGLKRVDDFVVLDKNVEFIVGKLVVPDPVVALLYEIGVLFMVEKKLVRLERFIKFFSV